MPNNHLAQRGNQVDALAFAQQLDRTDEVNVRGRMLRITTVSGSTYIVDDLLNLVRRNSRTGEGRIHGATFGGSMLLIDRILPGALMELTFAGQTLTTSPVKRIEILR